jgi:hypothetical protein
MVTVGGRSTGPFRHAAVSLHLHIDPKYHLGILHNLWQSSKSS